jgi:hypothetical protein
MIRSTNQKLGEYELIRKREHVERVWATIEEALPSYWTRFIEGARETDAASKLATALGGSTRSKPEASSSVLSRVYEKALSSYEKDSERYRHFFDAAAMEEYFDDPNAFKQMLSKDVPVIANTLRNRRADLKEWQMAFRACSSKELLQVFGNVMDFTAQWLEEHPADAYAAFDTPEAFELDPLDGDATMLKEGVVGMGIKSIILYHLDPQRLPARGRFGLYGLYFLSGKQHYGLPSKSSEFIMVNDLSPAPDGSIIMDQNYWYPYGLFSLYSLRVYRWMATRAASEGFRLADAFRYVYTERFFEAVCAEHQADLHTMRAHERFEVHG